MKSTLKDVAALAGVSVATASLALNNKDVVNKETKATVLNAARKLDYVQSAMGRNLITGKSNTISLYILNSKDNPDLTGECSYFYPMIRGILNVAEEKGYSFNFMVKYWNEIDNSNFFIKKSRDQSNDGMIIVPQYDYHYSFLQGLEEQNFPYVLINARQDINKYKNVLLDNYYGAKLATNYLIELGYREIGLINGPANHYDAILREKGFVDSMTKADLSINHNIIKYGDFTTTSGCKLMKEMINSKTIPPAIFCANDYMAAGAIQTLFANGYSVPEDVSIIGYDDTDIATGIFPNLTTIVNPTFKLGELAMEKLLKLINEEDDLKEIIVKPELIIRDSCREN